jgi:nitroreductase
MDTINAINVRKSIRKFKNVEVKKDLIEKVLDSATLAPFALSSGHEPWRFIVLEGEKKRELVDIIESVAKKSINRKSHIPIEENDTINENSIPDVLKTNAKIINDAPVFILAFGVYSSGHPKINHFDVHAISASVQNMLLSATDLGLGSLWIGAVWFAEKQICKWAGMDYLVAGVALGYSDDDFQKRTRKNWNDVTKWMK